MKKKKSIECVVDTTVLQKANASIITKPEENRKFARRIDLLKKFQRRELVALYSTQLVAEYRRKIVTPRNEFIRAFLELLTIGGHAVKNWHKTWSGDAEKARNCRYPEHDDHVLRTAIRASRTRIYTEEAPMLNAHPCVRRSLGVEIFDPTI